VWAIGLVGAGRAEATELIVSPTPTHSVISGAIAMPITAPTVSVPTATGTSASGAITPVVTSSAVAIASPTMLLGATATALPTRVPPTSWNWQGRGVRKSSTASNPTTCATTVQLPSADCPVKMSVAATNLSAATTSVRVGDVVRIDVTLATIKPVQFNAVQVAMEFDAAELVPVSDATGRVEIAPTTANENRNGALFHVASETFGPNATILLNTYTIVGTGSASGHVRLDAGIELPISGSEALPVTLSPGGQTVIGSLYVRVRNNPVSGSAHLGITLRDPAADDGRFSAVAMVDADDGGFNVLGPVASTAVTVERTQIAARLVVASPTMGSIRRIGDVVPVHLVIDATTPLRNARSVRASVTYDPKLLGLVVTPSLGAPTAPAFAASGSFAADLSRTAAVTNASGTAIHSFAESTASTSTGSVRLSVDGGPVSVAVGSTNITVATLYFRTLDRGDPTITLGAVAFGDALTVTPSDAATPVGDTLPFGVAVATTASATVRDVRGSVGVAIGVVGSPLAASDGTPEALGWTSTPTSTFTVTDGRYLDLEFVTLAGGLDAAGVDRVSIDVPLPNGLALASTGAPYILGADVEPIDASTMPIAATTSTLSIRARAKSGTWHAPTRIARVRFAVATSTFSSLNGPLELSVAPSTALTQTGTRFAANLHDVEPISGDAPLDTTSTVTRQKPASLVVPLRLQGRNANDVSAHFVQDADLFLAAPGAPLPAVRRATTVPPTALASAATGTMRYAAPTEAPASGTTVTVTLPDLDPGTYDLFVKGRSSLRARVAQVVLMPGDNAGTIPAPITLLEGDADRSDAINISDFAVLARSYASLAPNSGDTADFNQSGYIDAFDFSLLARNYGVRGPITLASLEPHADIPSRLATGGAATTIQYDLAVPASELLANARLSVTADARLGLACAVPMPDSTTCTADGPTRVTLRRASNTQNGKVALGAISLHPTASGAANLTATLADATGTDAAGAPTAYRAPSIASAIVVDPDVTYAVESAVVGVATSDLPAGIDVSANVSAAAGVKVTAGTVRLEYDATRLAVATTLEGAAANATACQAPEGASCDISAAGVVRFVIDDTAGLVGTPVFGPVRFVAKPDADVGPTSIRVSVIGLQDGAADPVYLPRLLTAAADQGGADVRTITIGEDHTVAATRVRAGAIRTRATRPTTGIWFIAPDRPVAPGEIVPVDVRLAAGVAVDAAQIVVRAGSGFTIVDANGNVASPSTVLTPTTGSPLPVVLRSAIQGLTGLVELALGRQMGQATGGSVGDGRLGTIYLKVDDATRTATDPALTVLQSSGGAFATVIVGADGAAVDASGATAWLDINPVALPTVNESVTEVGTSVEPTVGQPAAAGAVDAGTGSVRAAPRASSTRAVSQPRGVAAGVAPVTTKGRLVTEDATRGVVTVTAPGRDTPIELRTGLSTTVPDQFCGAARHHTYIRLQDVGIAGATFGVDSGGALTWVSPENAGCVDWDAIASGNYTFTKEVIMQFRLTHILPGALIWVQDGARLGELYEVGADGIAVHVTAAVFATDQEHYRAVWGNVIPVSTAQLDDLRERGWAR
jgi:hypothetical protein